MRKEAQFRSTAGNRSVTRMPLSMPRISGPCGCLTGPAWAGTSPVKALIGLAAVVVLLGTTTGCAVPQPRGAGKLARITEPTTKRGYWLYLPADYVRADEATLQSRRWPLVVSFHGMKPFDNALPQALEWEQEADRYGFIVVAPELKAPDVLGQFPVRSVHPDFQSDEMATLAILDHVFATTRADPSNVLSTSWSSGGYMAHYMLNRHPDRFTCLAVRQSNFSCQVLDPQMTRKSLFHPVLIVNTQNDFAICRNESREAVDWYGRHGYKNTFWVIIKNKGHERTPDLAAEFFGRVAGIQPSRPPVVLAQRQAIDGNAEGLAFLAGKTTALRAPPGRKPLPSADVARLPETPPRPQTPSRTSSAADGTAVGKNAALTSADVPKATLGPQPPTPPRTVAPVPRVSRSGVVSIRVSTAIGIEPLFIGFSAECPSDWQTTADFLWTLNGNPIGNGLNGQARLSTPGEHTLGLLVVTSDGQEHRASKIIRVMPRVAHTSFSDGGAP